MPAAEALHRSRAQELRVRLCPRKQSMAASHVCWPALPQAVALAVSAGGGG